MKMTGSLVAPILFLCVLIIDSSTAQQQVISSEYEKAESLRYWTEPKFSNENVTCSNKHWDFITRLMPAYDQFIHKGTAINTRLNQEMMTWARDQNEDGVKKWILENIVPSYTQASYKYLQNLPGFTSFHKSDRDVILRLGQSASRILVASLYWYDPEQRDFRDFLSWREMTPGREDLFKKQVIEYADRVTDLEIDPIESSLLNGLIIFATDYPRLVNPGIIEKSHQKVLATLKAYTTAKFGAKNSRLKKLLGVLPEARRLGLLHYKMVSTGKVMAEEL